MRSLRWRLALTVGIVYLLHFAPNVVRETYLAVSLGDRGSIRVDQFMGLHPDLFTIDGRGSFINNNPGASFLGAVPYAIARPGLGVLFALKPELMQPKPQATYADPRPNRTKFMNEARARGLDVKLALAAAVMHAGLMVPLAMVAALAVFGFVRLRTDDERLAIAAALLYAFATPIFFRSAFLNQNAIIAHCVLFGFLALASMDPDPTKPSAVRRLLVAGFLLGWAILTDYSGAPLTLAFGLWSLWKGWVANGAPAAVRAGLWYTAGAVGPLAMLFSYQATAFGHPLLPAQAYMPATDLSVNGWHGLSVPTVELLWRNLFDPRYGLLAFSPLLGLAAIAPWIKHPPLLRRDEIGFALGAALLLWLFNSANQFALLQWNTGVRYMVPATPLLFLVALPIVFTIGSPARWLIVLATLAISWSVAMARESVPISLAHIFLGGFELPWLTTLEKTAGAYAPFLANGASPIALFVFCGAVLWMLWRPERRRGQLPNG